MTITIKAISPTSYGIFEGEKLRHQTGNSEQIIRFCKNHYDVEIPHECCNTPTGTHPFLKTTNGEITFEAQINRIRELRVKKGLTQTQLAELAGTGQNRISQYESGDMPVENMTIGQAKKIADALDVKIEDLL